MRKITLLFLVINSVAFAQGNFSVEGNSITWQHIYESELSEEKIQQLLEKDPELNPLSETFSGTTKPLKLKCDKSQPIFMRDQVRYFASIEFKEGRYRVTVNKIELIPSTTVELFGVESTTEAQAYETYQLRSRDGEIRGNKMAQNSLHCLDQYLQEKFRFKVEKDKW